MPELPEAEANRTRVEAGALNRTIEAIALGEVSHMDLPGENQRGRLVGRQFTEARRHGKVVFAGSQSGPWIAVHLGMTGSLRVWDEGGGDGPPDYAKLTFVFEGERRLSFRCPRKFGRIEVVDDPGEYVAASDLGPDALDISRDVFAERIGGSRGAVKSALMAQKKLAGIGNLWSDEVLFQTGTAPDARADELCEDRVEALFRTMRDVLAAVVDTGARYSQLPRDWLIAHREEGAECRRCGGTIARSKVGGRSAYFCEGHQTA